MRRHLLMLSLLWLSTIPAFAAPADTDSTFGGGIVTFCAGNWGCFSEPTGLMVQADGRIVVSGSVPNGPSFGSDWFVARLDAGGSLDGTLASGRGWLDTPFGGGNPKQSGIAKLVVRPDGSLLGAGWARSWSAPYRDIRLNAWNADGSRDTGFGVGGTKAVSFGYAAQATAMALQQDGRFVVAGAQDVPVGTIGSTVQRLVVIRYLPGGALDTWFAASGVFYLPGTDDEAMGYPGSVTIQPDLAVVLAYYDGNGHNKVLRLTRSGVLDSGFGNGGIAELDFAPPQLWPPRILVQPDGKIVGAYYDLDGKSSVFRLLANGVLDTSFNGQGWIDLDFRVADIALVPTGQILAVATTGTGSLQVARITSGGQLDPAFYDAHGNAGVATVSYTGDPRAAQVALQPDGRILIAGSLGAQAMVTRLVGEPLSLQPAAFAFTARTGVPLSAAEVSNTITISGLTPDSKVPILVSGGSYRINASPFTTAMGYVGNGDKVSVRHFSSAKHATTITTTIRVGGLSSSEAPWAIRGGQAVVGFTSTTR